MKKQKHCITAKKKYYVKGDCTSYLLKCKCGKTFTGWSINEVEKEYKRHIYIYNHPYRKCKECGEKCYGKRCRVCLKKGKYSGLSHSKTRKRYHDKNKKR